MILYESEVLMGSYEDFEIGALLIAVREHDDAAFSELVRRYTPMMNKVIFGFSDSGIRHDEAFSEACVALHRASSSYDISRSGTITFGLYARICVYRRLCDMLDRKDARIFAVDLDVDLIGSDNGIEQKLVGRERMLHYLSKAKELLSDYEYEVFLLYIDGYSTAEIAKKLGRDSKSVDNAKSRVFKQLRKTSDLFSDD